MDLTIRELAEMISGVVGFGGELRFDHSKPDGTPQKLLDVAKIHRLGWKPRVSLAEGIQLSYTDYLARQPANKSPVF
jgi:GDP-L-fucose synthase